MRLFFVMLGSGLDKIMCRWGWELGGKYVEGVGSTKCGKGVKIRKKVTFLVKIPTKFKYFSNKGVCG